MNNKDPKQKKKVIIAITKTTWGGAQKYVYDIAISLHKDRINVIVLTGSPGRLTEKLEQVGIRTIIISGLERNVRFFSEFKVFFRLLYILFKEKPTVFHVNSSKIGGLGGITGRITRVPNIIFTAHGWAHVEDRPWWQRLIIKLLHYLTVGLSHKTIAVSEIVKKQITRNKATKKITVIHNGIDRIYFKDKDAAKEFLAIACGREIKKYDTWIGTISELHKNKGLQYAIEAVNELPRQTCFITIGDGEEKERLLTHAKSVGVGDRVFFAGHIDNAHCYLKAFDIFVLTSIKEGLLF